MSVIPNNNPNVYVVEYVGPGRPVRHWPVVAWEVDGESDGVPLIAMTGQPTWKLATSMPDFSYHGLLVVDEENVEGELSQVVTQLSELVQAVRKINVVLETLR